MMLSKLKKTNPSVLIDELLNCGVTYCSITLLNSEGASYFSKSSSDEWTDKYIHSGLFTSSLGASGLILIKKLLNNAIMKMKVNEY